MKKALFYLWLSFFIVPLPLIVLFNKAVVNSGSNQFYYDAGIVAYCWWLMSVMLATRPRWLVQQVSLPKLYLMHALLGVGAIILSFLHRHNLVSMGNLIHWTGDWAWYLTVFGIIYASLFLSGWFTDHLHWAAQLKIWLTPYVKHQLSIWLHRLNLVVIGLIWLHVHVIGRINTHLGFMLLFDSYTAITLGWYFWKLLFPRRTHALVLSNKALNSTTLQLQLHLCKPFIPYHAGDFYFLSCDLIKDSHPFSVTTAPSAGRKLVFTIKMIGDDTKKLARLQHGDLVYLEGPYGHFDQVIQNSNQAPLVLIGLGAGITPLLSIAQRYQRSRPIKVLWCVHQIEDLYYDQQFMEMATEHFQYKKQIGHFTARQLDYLITPTERQQALFIIVGPNMGVIKLQHLLYNQGVSHQQLIDERLTM